MLNPVQQLEKAVPPKAHALSACRGNNIIEYALVGALVIVVSITGLQLIGQHFNSALAMVRKDVQLHQGTATAAIAARKQAAAAAVSGAVSQVNAAEIALLQESLAQKLQTSGANGATEMLANQLAATAALLLSQGNIDQNQYGILMKLANQGHKMAQVESMVEQAAKMANGDYTAFSNMKFTVDGQTYTAPQLAFSVGIAGPSPADFGTLNILTSQEGNPQPQMAAFLDLYNQALTSGALSDPLALSTVNSAATQIASLGEVTEDTMNSYRFGADGSPSALTDLSASLATQMSSSVICTTGDFQDNTVLCTP
jgi:hypothetical protein